MNNPTSQHAIRRCAGGRADRRGSAILLVLVAMVLMTILAGSLLQLTRFERIPRSESNIEVVIASVIDEILNQATEDLIDDAGNFLNTQYTTAAGGNGGGDEPFDFPWTNASISGLRTTDNQNGTPVTGILGGVMDDTWLAAHMPDFTAPGANTVYSGGPTDGTNGVWRKITSLTGLYLGGTGGSADFSAVSSPNEYAVSNLAVAANSDTNINTTSALLVDADGDGIGDARWEWAPLRQVGATQYVMAVRIVDLSARMDMNVALGSTPSPGTAGAITLSTAGPRGDGPTELDGAAFVGLMANADASLSLANARSDWRKAIEYRFTANTAATGTASVIGYDNNNANPPVETRRDYWTDGASRVSNTFGRNGETPGGGYDYSNNATFGLVDAFELLRDNGLNSPNTTTVEDLMPNFLRASATQENGYGVGAGTPPNSWSRQQFWELDPRKHVTMFGGSTVISKPVQVAQTRSLKVDVNEAVKTPANRTILRDHINTILANSNSAGLTALYPHLDQIGLANQLTANLADYIDDDNHLTVVGTATGFEALPYIAEVYTQRHYESAAQTNPPDVIWNANGVQGYVIEIGNPFAPDVSGAGRPVSLENIWIDMNGTSTLLSSLTGVPAELAPGEVLLLYQDSDGPLSSLDTYYSDNAGSDDQNTDGNFTTVHTAIGPVMDVTATTQTIGLQAALQPTPGTASGWNYSACEIELGGATVTEPSTAGIAGGPGVFAYIQTTYAGHGVGLRMMTVTKGGGSNDYTANTDSLQDPSINCDIAGSTNVATRTIPSTLANEAKTSPTGFANLANQQIIWPDSERERIHWIGDLLQIPLIGPNAPATTDSEMAEAFVTAAGGTTFNNTTTGTGINALLLPYQRYGPTTAAPVIDTNVSNATSTGRFGMYNMPHALMLMEQLTTFSPATDGENGDGSTPAGTETIAAPNDDEVLVPGKLNLNTASLDTLARLLPFPDLATRQAVASDIVARRESMRQNTLFGVGGDNIPAVAYTGLLYEQIENLAAVNPSQDGADTTNLGANSVRIDLNDHETALGTYVPADGVVDDREEELMLAKWISEVCETRSDVFAAYIVVHGYPVDNFSDGASESARLIVIFSRANVEGAGDKAVEIGRFRVN